MAEVSPLRRRMIDDMTVRNLSPATQRSYVHAVSKFARFFGRSPETLDLEDGRTFQVHLVAGGMSWPALNQTVCALRFLYGVTLRRADPPERIVYAREPQKLPVVVSTEEIVRFLEVVPRRPPENFAPRFPPLLQSAPIQPFSPTAGQAEKSPGSARSCAWALILRRWNDRPVLSPNGGLSPQAWDLADFVYKAYQSDIIQHCLHYAPAVFAF